MEMLDPSADEIRDWGRSVIQFMTDYLGDLRDRPVYRQMSSREIRDGLDAALPTKRTDFDALLKANPFTRYGDPARRFATRSRIATHS